MDADLLKSLSPDEADRVLALGKRMVLTSGAKLFHLGDAAECIYLIIRGQIRLTLPMNVRGGEEDVLVEERFSGQTVGWSALIRPYRFTLSATAAMESEVIALRRSDLDGYFMVNPVTGYLVSLNVAGVMGQRLQTVQAMWLREVERMVEARCA